MLLLDGKANYDEELAERAPVDESASRVRRKLFGKKADGTSTRTNLILDRRATTQRSDSGVSHSFCAGAVCESCVGQTQTCGMPIQRLALRLHCLLKPSELGFIAGVPLRKGSGRRRMNAPCQCRKCSGLMSVNRKTSSLSSHMALVLPRIRLATATIHLGSIFDLFHLSLPISSVLLPLRCEFPQNTDGL